MSLSKRYATLVVLAPAAVLVGLSTLPWARGEARDVLAHGLTEVTGGQAAPGIPGLAAVCAVGLLGLLTGGRVIRAVAAVAIVLAAAGATVFAVLVATRPVDAVAGAVARELARTTAPAATGSTTPWAWVAVVVSVALVAGCIATALSSRSWAGLSGRYDRGERPASGPRGEVRTAWDELSDGGDPTLRDAPDET